MTGFQDEQCEGSAEASATASNEPDERLTFHQHFAPPNRTIEDDCLQDVIRLNIAKMIATDFGRRVGRIVVVDRGKHAACPPRFAPLLTPLQVNTLSSGVQLSSVLKKKIDIVSSKFSRIYLNI